MLEYFSIEEISVNVVIFWKLHLFQNRMLYKSENIKVKIWNVQLEFLICHPQSANVAIENYWACFLHTALLIILWLIGLIEHCAVGNWGGDYKFLHNRKYQFSNDMCGFKSFEGKNESIIKNKFQVDVILKPPLQGGNNSHSRPCCFYGS